MRGIVASLMLVAVLVPAYAFTSGCAVRRERHVYREDRPAVEHRTEHRTERRTEVEIERDW